MEKKVYDRLNNYLNDVCIELSKDDTFFLENLEGFMNISVELRRVLEKYRLKDYKQSNNMSVKELLLKSKNIIGKINPEYIQIFEDVINKGILDIDFDEEKDEFSKKTHFSPSNHLIEISSSFDNKFVSEFNHEFFHYTNEGRLLSRYLLTEFISIYYELYTNDELFESGEEKIDFTTRLKFLYLNAETLEVITPILLAFYKFGSLSEDTYRDIDKYFIDMTKEEYEDKVMKNLIMFERLVEETKSKDDYFSNKAIGETLASPYQKNYKYMFGSLLAFYSLAYIEPDEILKLNEDLRNDTKLGIFSLLDKIGIHLDSNFHTDSFNAIENYIKIYRLDKKEK